MIISRKLTFNEAPWIVSPSSFLGVLSEHLHIPVFWVFIYIAKVNKQEVQKKLCAFLLEFIICPFLVSKPSKKL
jgi:hypothetical protein